MASNLGFDRSLILADGLKTARATLPTAEELLSPAAVGNLAFGQGSLLGTPVHVAQMVAAVVNGGKIIRPTILKGYCDREGRAVRGNDRTRADRFLQTDRPNPQGPDDLRRQGRHRRLRPAHRQRRRRRPARPARRKPDGKARTRRWCKAGSAAFTRRKSQNTSSPSSRRIPTTPRENPLRCSRKSARISICWSRHARFWLAKPPPQLTHPAFLRTLFPYVFRMAIIKKS